MSGLSGSTNLNPRHDGRPFAVSITNVRVGVVVHHASRVTYDTRQAITKRRGSPHRLLLENDAIRAAESLSGAPPLRSVVTAASCEKLSGRRVRARTSFGNFSESCLVTCILHGCFFREQSARPLTY